jgi:hypothetical protein
MTNASSDELSPEAELAAQIAYSVLHDGNELSAPAAVNEGAQPEQITVASSINAVESVLVDEEAQHDLAFRNISARDEIPLTEKHVLVMWGLSTYRYEHALGVTFIVNNSRYNKGRDREYQEAKHAASELARSQGLEYVYCWE